ncbi:gas vesicle protein GvpO [Plantactinospora solaniradicis]|uniref:Gas vesicle protein GvpO n=1 Tax=Plantactinospora solaniradicis TaxID=1723736 RepID=A0ABW1KLU6_9ACTN
MASGESGADRASRRRNSRISRSGRHDDDQQDTEYRDHDDYPDDDYPDDDYPADEPDDEPDDGPDDEPDFEPDDDRSPRARRRTGGTVSAPVAARSGLRHVAELTGKPVTGVTSLDRTEHGWLIGVEVVEDPRVPSSADILAVYQTELDVDGDLLGYRRTRRYARGRGDSGGGAG